MSNNHRQISVLLIQSGVDVNLRDKQGCTALHYVQSKTVLKVLHIAFPQMMLTPLNN